MTKKAFVLVSALVLACALALRFVDFDAPLIGREALSRVAAATGIDFVAERFRWNFVQGLKLENLEASGHFPTGKFEISVAEMRFEPRRLALLSGRVQINRGILERPRIEVVYGLPLAENAPMARRAPRVQGRLEARPDKPAVATTALDVSLDSLELRDAALLVRDQRARDGAITASGLDVSIREPELSQGALTLLHAISAAGELFVAELRLGSIVASDVKAELSTAAGRVDFSGSLSIGRAILEGDVHLDFNTLPFRYRMTLQGRLSELLSDLRIEAKGFGVDPKNLEGEGWVEIPEGTVLWKTLTIEEPTRVDLEIADARVLLRGKSIEGSMDFEGRLDLRVDGRQLSGTWDELILNDESSSRNGGPQFAPREGRRETRPPHR